MNNSKFSTLIKYVLPSILSSTCYFLFTVIDGIFIGRGVGDDGLGAINILFPFIMIANALFLLASIGGVSVVAVRMGRGDIEGANHAFLHSLTLVGVFSAVLTVIGCIFTGPLITLLGGNTPAFYDLCIEYTFYYSLFLIPSGLSMTMQNYCRNDGAQILVSAATIIGTAVNIFGDWLLIFHYDMGMKGAALATGISQALTFLIIISHFVLKKGKLRIRRFTFTPPLISKIFLRGLPECIAQFSIPVSTICMNYVLLDLTGPVGVNAFSLLAYVACFTVAVFVGSAQGLQPLFGQSFGGKRREDLRFFFRSGVTINLVGSGAIVIALPFFSRDICALFGADPLTLEMAVKFLPYFAWGFIAESMNSIISAYLYSTKRSKEAIFTNVLRSFIVPIAVTLILPYVWKNDVAVWMTFGVYQAIVAIVGIIITYRTDKRLDI